MKKSTRYSAALALLVALGLLAGCNQAASDASVSSQEDALSGQQTAASAMDTSALFSDRDLEGTYDESAAVAIQLSGDSAACDSSAVTVEGSTITITAEGVYLLSGTLTDGQIVVNAGETDKVQLVLKGADITSSTSAQPGGHSGWSKGTPPDAPDTQAAATQAPQVQTTAAQTETTQTETTQTETTQTETTQTETDTTDSTSQKGIKAEGGLVVNGGVFTMDTVDDGLHTGADLLVTAGEFTHNGGDLTTNDGSEDNPGQMGGGGGRGGMGQDGQRPSREPGSLQPPTDDTGDSSTAQ